LTGRWLGFKDAQLRIDTTGTWSADILVDGIRVDGGPELTTITGRYLVAAGLLTTAAVITDRE
jgi:4'-phosphopantetheinyl transferase EntD